MCKTPIFLDHHATTPMDPRVLNVMTPYFRDTFGNAASRVHMHGKRARKAVAKARAHVAALLGARVQAEEIVWTSGATESDNLAIKGVVQHVLGAHGSATPVHVVTQATEHKAVLDSCQQLARQGVRVTYLPVDAQGRVDPEAVGHAITAETCLVSVMLANNEVGTVQDVTQIGKVAREHGVLFHCDAAQGIGLVPFDVDEVCVDLVSLSAHKMYGPQGVGALYVRKGVALSAQMNGGGHEAGRRSGTLNVPGVVGFGEAACLLHHEGAADAKRIAALRDALYQQLCAQLEGVHLHGPSLHGLALLQTAEQPTDLTQRHPGNLHVGFEDVESAGLLLALSDEMSVSSGAACSTEIPEPSHVLQAMGIDTKNSIVRFGLGRETTQQDIEEAARAVISTVAKLREASPFAALRRKGIAPEDIDW